MDEILVLAKEAYAGDVIELLSGNNQESFKYYKRFFTDMKISGNALAMQIKKKYLINKAFPTPEVTRAERRNT